MTSYPGDHADIANLTGDTTAWFDADGTDLAELEDATPERTPFVPGYGVIPNVRIIGTTLQADDDGTATATFRGDLDATRITVKGSRTRQVPRLYAEVDKGVEVHTEVKVALVPTGKRVPQARDGSPALRLGQAGRVHVYLLSVESKPAQATVDALSGPDDGLSGADAHLDDTVD